MRDSKLILFVFGAFLVTITCLYLIPAVIIFSNSFFVKDLGGTSLFVGLNNFVNVISDHHFYNSLIATVLFTLISVTVQVLFALGLALLVYRKFSGVNFLHWIFLSPYFLPTIVVVIAWNFFTDPGFGIITSFMSRLGFGTIDFRNPHYAIWGMLAVSIYEAFPFCFALFLARLLQLPPQLYLIADLDRTNMIKKFTHITWPQIKNIFWGLFLLRLFITALKFDVPYLVYGFRGKTFWSETFSVWVYRTAFEELDKGKAFAAAFLVLLSISVSLTLLYKFVYKRNIVEDEST